MFMNHKLLRTSATMPTTKSPDRGMYAVLMGSTETVLFRSRSRPS